jgi:hypothetical protein
MLSGRAKAVSLILFYGISVLCLCVVMYMLGSTMTLWTLQFAFDETDNPVLEGFSLPTIVGDFVPAMLVASSREQSTRAKGSLNEHSLLRPPNPTA